MFKSFRNINRTFQTEAEYTYWQAEVFYPKTEMLLNTISLIIRVFFLQISWKPPIRMNSLYIGIYVVSIYTYISILLVFISLLIAAYFVLRNRNRIPRNRIVRPIFNLVPVIISQYTSAEECPICLENPENQQWIELECLHKFHYNCMNEYIRTLPINLVCPICRTNINSVPIQIAQV